MRIPNLSFNSLLRFSNFFTVSFSEKLSGLQKNIYFVFANLAPRFAACPKPEFLFKITSTFSIFFSNLIFQ